MSGAVPALDVRGLRVDLESSGHPIVIDVDLSVAPGEVLGIVGESGSGKTTAALASLGFARAGARISGGSVSIGGSDILSLSETALRGVRGKLASYVPQEPASTINPSIRVGDWVGEVLRAHFPKADFDAETAQVFERVGLPSTTEFRRRFVHQLSGGQAQRVAIATAFVGGAPLVILDEPTTGLDVITQATILDEIARLQQTSGVAMVYVSHDLSVVGRVADRIAVMYAGRVVEQAPAAEVLARPRHPYSRGLVESVPDHVKPRRIVAMPGVAAGVEAERAGCSFAPRCPQRVARCETEVPAMLEASPAHTVRCFEWSSTPPSVFEPAPELALADDGPTPLLAVEDLHATYRSRRSTVIAAQVSFTVGHGESLALVGESGSGKTTIARCVAGLHLPDAGRILLDGELLAGSARHRPVEHRRRIQIVFQNPNASLNPDHTVADAVARPLKLLRTMGASGIDSEVRRLLELVRLPAGIGRRYPARDLGRRTPTGRNRPRTRSQTRSDRLRRDHLRARRLRPGSGTRSAVRPPHRTGTRAAVHLPRPRRGRTIADRVLVLKDGTLREQGVTRELLAHPSDPYTQLLVASAPRIG